MKRAKVMGASFRRPIIRVRKRKIDIEVVPALSINGHWIKGTQTHIALLTRLYKNLGRVVSYKVLCDIAGHSVAGKSQVHIFRQYIPWIKRTLNEHMVPCVIAVAEKVGYALCELA